MGNMCDICAEAILIGQQICGLCQKKAPYFNKIYSLWPYEEPFKQWVNQLKSKPLTFFAYLFAREMYQQFSLSGINEKSVIIPVPLHKKRYLERGFNQAELIAKEVSRLSGLPINTKLIHKICATKPQSESLFKERRRNLSGAFKTKKHQYPHVILIDDVITTGSTVNEIAKVIKEVNNCSVDVWSVCRAIKK